MPSIAAQALALAARKAGNSFLAHELANGVDLVNYPNIHKATVYLEHHNCWQTAWNDNNEVVTAPGVVSFEYINP